MRSSTLPHAGSANRHQSEPPKTTNQLTTAPRPSVTATLAPKPFSGLTGGSAEQLSNLKTLISYSSSIQAISSLPDTQATASIGTALPGRPKRTRTPTRFALSIDYSSTRISPSTNQFLRTAMADFACLNKCTTLQTNEERKISL